MLYEGLNVVCGKLQGVNVLLNVVIVLMLIGLELMISMILLRLMLLFCVGSLCCVVYLQVKFGVVVIMCLVCDFLDNVWIYCSGLWINVVGDIRVECLLQIVGKLIMDRFMLWYSGN